MEILIGENKEVIEHLEMSYKRQNIEVIDYSNSSILEIIKTYNTISLLELAKVIIVINPLFLINKSSSLKKKEIPLFDELCQKIEENKTTEVNKNKLYLIANKEINLKIKYIEENSKFLKIERLDEVTLINNYTKSEGIKISKEVIKYFLEKLDDGYSPKLELQKLFLEQPEREITQEVIDLNIVFKPELIIFDFVEEILRGNKKKAHQLYQEKVLVQGYEDVQILAIMMSQLRFITNVKLLKQSGMAAGKIATSLKVSPYRIQKNSSLIAGLSFKRIKEMYSKITKYDYLIKSGKSHENEVILNFLY